MTAQKLFTYNDLDTQLERFEASWRGGDAPQIEDFLPSLTAVALGDTSRHALLIELLMIDMERRWRLIGGRSSTASLEDSVSIIAPRSSPPSGPLLEDYVQQFPELGSMDELPLRLIADEYRVRCRWGDQPSHESYLGRFRRAPAEMLAALTKVDRLLQQSGGADMSFPRAFGNHTLLAEIARGGMGIVYKARHEKLGRLVALKVVLSGQLASKTEIERFYTEARAGAHLDHPGIVPIHEVGQHAGQHYLSMSYVDGESLAEKVSAGPLPPEEAAEILRAVAEAVAYAHRQGVIHRDLKPANIMLDQMGRPRVTDFGLAKRVEGDSGLTATGQILGTPSFMPPEQAAGQLDWIGPKSDVYALGAVLYNLTTGRPPFQAANPIDTVLQVMDQDPVAARKLNTQVPRDLETICMKCLEKDPELRYPSAVALSDDLQRYLRGEAIQARPVSSISRAWRWAHRHRAVASLLMIVGMLVGCVIVGTTTAYWMLRSSHAQTEIALVKAERESQRATEAEGRALASLEKLEKESKEKRAAQAEATQALMRTNEAQALAERAGSRADAEAERAGEASEQAKKDRSVAQAAREQQEYGSFRQGIAVAELALREGNTSLAEERLARCPQTFRSWEWNYLKHLCATPAGEILLSGGSLWDRIPHPAAVNDLAISPNGKLMATVCDDGFLRVRDPAQGETILEQLVSAKPLHVVAFGPQGQLLAVAGEENRIHVWDLERGKRAATLSSGGEGTFALAFNQAGLVAGGGDGSIRYWPNLKNRKPIIFQRQHKGRVRSLWSAYFPPTKSLRTGQVLFASVGEDGRFVLWHGDGRPVTNLICPLQFNAPVFADSAAGLGVNGGFYVATKPRGRISHWHIVMKSNYVNAPIKVLEPGKVTTRDERGRSRTTTVDQVKTKLIPFFAGTSVQVVPGEPIRIPFSGERFSVSPDRNTLAVRMGKVVIIWDAHSGKELHTFDDHQGDVTRMIWSPTSQWFATASRDRMVRIWNLSERSERHAGGIRSIAFNPVDDRFASAGDDRTVKLWKSPNGGFIDSLRHRADVGSLCFDPTGQFLATGCSNGFVVLWDIATPNSKLITKHTVHTGAVRCVVFSPDGRQLASAGIDKTIYLWPIEGSSEPKPFTRQDSEINFIAYRPNRGKIASGAADGTITLLDLESDATASLGNIPDEVICLAFSPDGQRLASVRSDGTVRVWDLDSETEMAKSTHPGATAVLFSPDGKRVFVSTSEGSVKIIDARTGFSLLTLTGQSPLNCLALNHTGDLLVAGGENGELRVWNAIPVKPALDEGPDHMPLTRTDR